MSDIRRRACEIAKRMAKESGISGDKPNRYMKQAWAEAKGEKALKFFYVEYKTMKGWKKAIVQAPTKEAATAFFYKPGDRTLNSEVREVRETKKAPKGWETNLKDGRIAKLSSETDLTAVGIIEGTIRDKKVTFSVADILGINPPRKDAVLK